MSVELTFLSFSCFLIIMDCYNLIQLSEKNESKIKASNLLFIVATLIVVVAYLRLVFAFINDEFVFQEVYSSSSLSLPVLYKVAASWAGASSSFLFMLFLISIIFAVYRFKAGFGESPSELNLKSRTYLLMDLMFLLFTVLVLVSNPFERCPFTPPDGAGLNPMLKSIWMIIHPVTLFLGYIFTFIPVAYVFAGLSLGRNVDSRDVKVLMELSWFFLTIGISLGGLWAYGVLGWGGYWAWDPVETASLIPWLTITAYFHLPSIVKRNKNLMNEFTIFLSFVLVMFAMFVTRGGLLQSVHAFASSLVGVSMGVTLLFFAMLFPYLKIRSKRPIYGLEVRTESLNSITSFSMYICLIILATVCTMGILIQLFSNMLGASLLVDHHYYNNLCYPFTLGFIASLIGCSLPSKFTVKKYLLIILSALVVGAFLIVAKFPTPNFMANFGMPIVIAALASVSVKLARNLRKFKPMSFGRSLIHLGVCLILMGVFISTTAVVASGHQHVRIGDVNKIQIDGQEILIELGNLTVQDPSGSIYVKGERFFEKITGVLEISCKSGLSSYNSKLILNAYFVYGLFFEPAIISTPTVDYYIIPIPTDELVTYLIQGGIGEQTKPETIIINVKVIPMVKLVWIGILLMPLGMIYLIATRVKIVRMKRTYASSAR